MERGAAHRQGGPIPTAKGPWTNFAMVQQLLDGLPAIDANKRVKPDYVRVSYTAVATLEFWSKNT